MRLFLSGAAIACATFSSAAFIVQPVSVTNGTPDWDGFGTYGISQTCDQSGLLYNYSSGVTDFDQYVTSPLPWHSSQAAVYEWWAPLGYTSDWIIYDLGASMLVDRVALWNEEAAGLDSVTVTTANMSDFSDAMAGGGFTATDWGNGSWYLPDVYSLSGGARMARYIRLDVTADMTPSTTPDPYVSMGEFAVSVVPEPSALLAIGAGLGLLVARRKRS